MKKLAVIACISTALAATSAAAVDFGEYTPSVDACFSLGTIDDIAQRLMDDGWMLSPKPIHDEIANQLAWPQAQIYILGDKGGEALSNIIALQKQTIIGFSKKRDIATSKTRILSRGTGEDMESLLLLWQVPYPHIAFVKCRFALKADSYAETFDEAITYLGQGPLGANKTYSAMAFNTDLLSEKFGSEVTVGAALTTHFKFSPEDLK